MTAPDYVAKVAGVIREFIVEAVGFDNGELMTAQAEELALKLAAAGLIPTSTEWGVRHPFLGPDARTIEPKHRALYGDHWTILTRAVTDWKDATDD